MHFEFMGDIRWAPSSEFVSSSIPSWQISTAHVQPFRGDRDLVFCLKVPLDSLLVWASSEGSGETARMRRLAWTFAARIGDKYQIRLTRSRWYLQSVNCICHELTASSLEESLADKVLQSCHDLKISITNIADLPVTVEPNNNGPTRQVVIHRNSVEMTIALKSLITNCSVWASLYQSLQSALIHDLLSRMSEHVKVIGSQITRFLQVSSYFSCSSKQLLNFCKLEPSH